jgi:hypothetical protein
MTQTPYIADGFYVLALLACPIGMGLMMWLMMHGNKQSDTTDNHQGKAR